MQLFNKKISESAIQKLLRSKYVLKSQFEKLTTIKKFNVLLEKEFSGGNIAIIALYEKAQLRPDIKKYLRMLKHKGIFIIAINTLKLSTQSIKENTSVFNVYIERDNSGRDFGSYKDAILYFYKMKMDESCTRLIICNDSVFYSKEGLSGFIDEMTNSDIPVMGVSENHDISHHMGSFYLSFSSEIFKHLQFKRFWFEYKKTNIRPDIIMNGEVKLSETLKSMVISKDDFLPLYSIDTVVKKRLKTLPETVDSLMLIRDGTYSTHSKIILFNLFISDQLVMDLFNEFKLKRSLCGINYNGEHLEFVSFLLFLKKISFTSPELVNIHDALKRVCEMVFSQGSQVHLNNLIFKRAGMPIVKLDLFYRSAYSIYDTLRLINEFSSKQEQKELKFLLLRRKTGRCIYSGLDRHAFASGYI